MSRGLHKAPLEEKTVALTRDRINPDIYVYTCMTSILQYSERICFYLGEDYLRLQITSIQTPGHSKAHPKNQQEFISKGERGAAAAASDAR